MAKTPNRCVRVSDETWEAAMAQAAEDGVPLSRSIESWLREYAGLDPAE